MLAVGGYRFVRLDSPRFPNATLSPIDFGTGFSLTGCTDGMASPMGFSFFAEEVRALWGVERIAVDSNGTFRDRLMLRIPEELGLRGRAEYERVGRDDGSYTALWFDPAMDARQAIQYGADEQPGAVELLRHGGSQILGAVATDDGFVDASSETMTSAAVMFSFFDRAGARRDVVRPGGHVDTPASFSMASARGTLLAFSQAERAAGLQLETTGYSYASSAFASLPALRLDSPLIESRATAVADGALVVWADRDSTLHALPLGCR